MRYLLVSIVVALSAAASHADVIVVKKGKGYDIVGLKSEIDGVPITIDNWKAYAEQSTGHIVREGYSRVWFDKSGKGKGDPAEYSNDDVVDMKYTTDPKALAEGFDAMSVGNWRQAIARFRDVAADTGVRPVYRTEAQFQLGVCYYSFGQIKQAIAHFEGWDIADSKYTPEAYRIAAALLTARKKFKEAREWYTKIGALEGVPDRWKFLAKLGDVKVDIEENKHVEAEGKARQYAREIGTAKERSDSLALAYALQGRAIMGTGKKERLPEAQRILEDAAALGGVSETNMAEIHTALGDVIYAQGKPEQARFSYMRVVCLYPGQSDYVANALLNAGQCFLDMSGREKADQKKSDDYLVQGMKLLAECGFRHKSSSAGRQARGTYAKHKQDFEAAQKRLDG